MGCFSALFAAAPLHSDPVHPLNFDNWPDGWIVAKHGTTRLEPENKEGVEWLHIARVDDKGIGGAVFWEGVDPHYGRLGDLQGSVLVRVGRRPATPAGVILGADNPAYTHHDAQNFHGLYLAFIPDQGNSMGGLGLWYNSLTTENSDADAAVEGAFVEFPSDFVPAESICLLEFQVQGNRIEATLWSADEDGNKMGSPIANLEYEDVHPIYGYFGLKAGRFGGVGDRAFRDVRISPYGTATSALRILNIGDSLSNGTHLQTLQEHFVEAGFPRYDFVGPAHKTGNPRNTPRQAYGGMRLADMLHGRERDGRFQPGAMESLPKFSPNVILLLGGTNNIVRLDPESLGPMQEDLHALVDFLVESAPEAIVFVSNIPPVHSESRWAGQLETIQVYNEWLRDYLAERRGAGDQLVLVDFASKITETDFADDGLHLNETGQQKLGTVWFDALDDHGLLMVDAGS